MRVTKTTLSESEQAYLIENTGKHKQTDLAKWLEVSVATVAKYQRQLGLRKDRAPIKRSKFRVKKVAPIMQGAGYCLDCINYREGGLCRRSGKSVGALHKKECFKAK